MAIPGKDALSFVNAKLQRVYGVNVTPSAIIDSMRETEMPVEIIALLGKLKTFSETPVQGAQF